MKVLVTGATGFIGRHLCRALTARGDEVVRVVRAQAGASDVAVGDIDAQTDWRAALSTGPEVVVHLAARVHVMNESVENSLEAFRAVNVNGTLNLARRAAAEGVKRFIYLSSIKVNGEITVSDRPFQADDEPHPQDAYAISKNEAETSLRDLARTTGLEVVVIRPPLVYGPGVKGNFVSMLHWLARGMPLPLGAVTHNRRSLVALDNLAGLIVTCLDHPAAANQTFLVSDGEDLSTADLLRRLGQAMGRPVRLVPVPVGLLELGARLAGKPEISQRLCGSLQVDISKTLQLLGWVPSVGVDEGLRKTLGGLGC